MTDPKHPASRPDPGVQYIWDLAADAEGQPLRRDRPDRPALEAVGRRARGRSCSTASTPTCSASRSAPDGSVYAGSDGEGLIYKVAPDGKVSVVYDAPQSEVRTLLVAPDGTLYAGTAAEAGRRPGRGARRSSRDGGLTSNAGSPAGGRSDTLDASSAPTRPGRPPRSPSRPRRTRSARGPAPRRAARPRPGRRRPATTPSTGSIATASPARSSAPRP